MIITRYVLTGSSGVLSFQIPFGGKRIDAIQANMAIQGSATDCLAQLLIGRTSNPALAANAAGDQFTDELACFLIGRNMTAQTANISQYIPVYFPVTRVIWWHLSLSGAVATAVSFTLYCS